MTTLYPLMSPRFSASARSLFLALVILTGIGHAPAMAEASQAAADKPTAVLPPLPQDRIGGAAVLEGDRLYYLSGAFSLGRRVSYDASSILVLELTTGSWKPQAEMEARASFSAVLFGGEILFAGGSVGIDHIAGDHHAWNPVTKRVRTLKPLPGPRYMHGAVNCGGKIYVVGGGPKNHREIPAAREVWMYDPAADSWNRKADLLIAMRNVGVVELHNKIYAIGGHGAEADHRGQVAQRYDPATDRWERLADMPTPRTDLACVVHGNRIFVIGGHPRLNVVESFDPVTNTWRSEPPLPHGRFAPAAVSYRDEIIIVGGLPNVTLRYRPSGKD